MSQQFKIGDSIRCARTGLEAEVIGCAEHNPELILCGWFDWRDEFQEVYFMSSELVLVKTAAKEETKA
jgi:hypothetical protein